MARRIWIAEGLELRGLLSTGLSGLTNLVQELGTVTKSAAAHGVEATALIPSQSSVTFKFNVQSAGNYTLLVRHVGDGLTLDAQLPSGSVSVNPGPAGPFEVIPLRLSATSYAITAAAHGGKSVYVDWELLLNSGVGQTSASTPSVIVPLAAGSTSATTAATAPGMAATASSTQAAPTALPAALAQGAEARSGVAPIELVGNLIGRPDASTATPPPVLALTPATPESGVNPLLARLDSALVVSLQPAARATTGTVEGVTMDPEVPVESSWYNTFFGTVAHQAPTEAGAEANPAEYDIARFLAEQQAPTESERSISMAAVSPGLALGAVAVTIAARSRKKGTAPTLEPARRTGSPKSATEPTIQRLRAVFERSYRNGRCQPVRPLANPQHLQAR